MKASSQNSTRKNLGISPSERKVYSFGAALFVMLVGLASFGGDCDDDDKKDSKKEGTPVASATPPTPEKIAGMGDGAIKICVITKGDVGETMPFKITFAESSDKPVDIVLKKAEKGYCEYWKTVAISRLWWNGLRFSSPAVMTEVGVYYLKEYKDNPAKDDVSYAKAELIGDDVYALNVRVISQQVPHIEVHAK